MSVRFCLLVVAKAPVPGFAKTRLCPPATAVQAAEIAATALLDTLAAVLATRDAVPVVAMTGELGEAARGTEIAEVLGQVTVLAQRGDDFGARLANAHADTAAAYPALPVLQIGMDTPQVTPDLLTSAVNPVLRGDSGATLGAAEDGGWWALGLRDPLDARVLAEVPMSRPDTGARTRRALTASGLSVTGVATLSDVDTIADARRVAARCVNGRFARAVAEVAGLPALVR
ncbi:TIGR04282 family arsenosugar biosynthesis glycosyltransferase [Amycolatopsis samaneae]|uniref:DUF2064 domain-containing protein n=1 Tax=Amycolatopsis samaneae TaxID=664691 RepID=A0ABW5GIE1_9PSEU